MSRRSVFDRTLRLAACVGAILAAGCGGGSDEAPAPPPPELLQITSQNQLAVAQATAMNFFTLDSVRDMGDSRSPSASAVHPSAMLRLALEKIGATARASSARVGALAVSTVTEPCPYSGSVTVSFDDRDGNGTPSNGDVLTSVFNDCRETPTAMAKGSFSVNVAAYSPPVISGLFTFGQLALADETGTATLDGQANLAYQITPSTGTTRIEMKVTGTGLVGSVTLPKYKETFTFDPDFSGVWEDVSPQGSGGYSNSSLSGKVRIASLDGKIAISTEQPVHDFWANEWPDSGKVKITGHQSKVYMTILGAAGGRLELDANDDGVIETAGNVPWTQLLPF